MIKKIFTISFLFLLIGCGFKPMLKNFDTSKLIIQKLNYIGKNELTYLLHTNLGLKEKKTSGGLIVDLTINENLVSATKSTAGITTEEELIIRISLSVKNSDLKILSSDSFEEKKRLTVTNNLSTDDNTKNIERIKLIQNLSQKIKFKLLIIADNS